MGCVACQKPLTSIVEVDDEDDVGQEPGSSSTRNVYTVPDSVQLQCGCHFHWQCLLDAYSMTECPNCGRDISAIGPSGEQQILCNLENEGGLQEGLDILPLLTEESYLKAYPEERRCRAFLEFCGEGDIEAIVDLLDDGEDEAEEDNGNTGAKIDALRYQDPMGSMNSGLHIAVVNRREEVAWLLLLLASNLELDQFPSEVLQTAEKMGVARENQIGKMDIRVLKDAEGSTAGKLAQQTGGTWNTWLELGRLSVVPH